MDEETTAPLTPSPLQPHAAPADTPATDRIIAAKAAIGVNPPGNRSFAPSTYPAALDASAPALAARLRRADVVAITEQYEEWDGAAVAAQAEFLRVARRARDAVLWTGGIGALLLAVGALATVVPPAVMRTTVLACAVGAVVTGAVAGAMIRRARDGKLLEDWMTKRARAETARLAYFDAVVRKVRLADPLLQLEFFRRYQLDVQRTYYKDRGAEHETAARTVLSRSAAAVTVASAATGLAGVLAGWKPTLASIAAFGLVAQAFAAREENVEATAQSRRNAERFARTRDALVGLTARLDDVRDATAAGRLDVLDEFVGAAQEQISVEHRQWVTEMSGAADALGRLETLLEEYKKSTTPPPRGG